MATINGIRKLKRIGKKGAGGTNRSTSGFTQGSNAIGAKLSNSTNTRRKVINKASTQQGANKPSAASLFKGGSQKSSAPSSTRPGAEAYAKAKAAGKARPG